MGQLYKNSKISELSSVGLDEILSGSDLFLVSEQESESTYVSKKIEFSTLETDFLTKFFNLKYFNPTKYWKFHEIQIPTKTVTNAYKAGIMSCVVNLEYLSTVFMKEYNNFLKVVISSDYPTIPSSVGEIIFSTKCKTEKNVKKYYGENTSWTKIEGRFLMATTKPVTNETDLNKLKTVDVTGGEVKTELDITHVPSHYHKFEAEENWEEYSHSYTLKPPSENGTLDFNAGRRVGDDNAGSDTRCSPATTHNISPSSELIESGILYGDDGEDVTIKENSSGNEKSRQHNNMPPFYCVHIWQRTK